jgi:periplasmic divalent cation tolerance protein
MQALLPALCGGSTRREDGAMDEECCEVVVTAADPEWLAGFTRTLVEERLAACGHVISPIRSIYRWEGAVHDESEARVALHTRRALVPAVIERTQELHPYDIPCVIALSLSDGDPEYVRWIVDETRDP